ncbi:tryptophan synthase beta subunit-like PLP-dependent enzyme [Podospora conica]|nr:tryptophan synthase beta subunit-like PLP-dependent enzyme [Schizothecium conicum]
MTTSKIHINPKASQWRFTTQPDDPSTTSSRPSPSVLPFHKHLPTYAPTPLHSLPSIAASLNVGHVLVKDESLRFGLPSFKVLGASWAVYRAVVERLGLLDLLNPPFPRLSTLGETARNRGLTLKIVTCTAGNWGRAVARMGAYMGIETVVYVPADVHCTTRELIRDEGAEVVVAQGGGYDGAVGEAKGRVEREGAGGLLVMDIAWEGHEDVPKWVVEGYQTMLDEEDGQVLAATGGRPATHAVVPVGCGSIAQAVTQHFKSASRERDGSPAAMVMGVEPETAACLKLSLERGAMTQVTTAESIMCGMNCGSLSTAAWPALQNGVDVAVVVSDEEAHQAVLELRELGVKAGPCGAATLAGLKRVCAEQQERSGLNSASVVVLHCTEGLREYDTPPNGVGGEKLQRLRSRDP